MHRPSVSSATRSSMRRHLSNPLSRAASNRSSVTVYRQIPRTSKKVYDLDTFCTSLNRSSKSTSIRIVSVKRFKESRTRHRFLVFHAKWEARPDFFIRLDRTIHPRWSPRNRSQRWNPDVQDFVSMSPFFDSAAPIW